MVHRLNILVAVALSTAVGCADEPRTEPRSAEDWTFEAQPAAGERPYEQASPEGTVEPRPTTQHAQMSEAQIFGVLEVANGSLIEKAEAALGQLKNAEARALAQSIARDYTQLNEQQTMLAQVLDVTAEQNTPKATSLRESMRAGMDRLDAAADMDREFIDQMEQDLRKIRDLIDTDLLPAAGDDARLETFLQNFRSTTATHLASTEELGTGTTPGMGPQPPPATFPQPGGGMTPPPGGGITPPPGGGMNPQRGPGG